MAAPEEFPLARELDAFEAHRQELMGRAAGRYALVHGDLADPRDVFEAGAEAFRTAGVGRSGASRQDPRAAGVMAGRLLGAEGRGG